MERTQAEIELSIWSINGEPLPQEDQDVARLFADHLEHVTELCRSGHTCGDLVGDGIRGWWKIKP